MELINQHTKKIMEGCKERARSSGLQFQDDTLEYIVTNRDLLELTPKFMIPTLYDYWVHDVEVIKEKGRYDLYPANPYETVINTRPPISFYNDNNPDWLNVMIFYHVLAHIDFFQNNLFFRHSWDYDFTGQALSDKRVIAKLRSEKGRWVDYVIEFARGIDNLVGFYDELSSLNRPHPKHATKRIDYYFDVFLQSEKKLSGNKYVKEIERYNECNRKYGHLGEQFFFAEAIVKYPEFEAIFEKSIKEKKEHKMDLFQFMMEHSRFFKKAENRWMRSVLEVIRNTSIFFQPQIRTKCMNEGWASYWHEKLFLGDDRINGHEVEFARINAGVISMPRVGLNPYALGMRLFSYIEEMADKGKYSFEFQRISDVKKRKQFDSNTDQGRKYIFEIRENYSDFMFINNFVEQDFVTRNKLFVAGKKLNKDKMVWEYYVKSRAEKDYRKMLIDSLYHPPCITIDPDKSSDTNLYLVHHFEEKALIKEFISNTMLGIEYLWGGPVQLETSEMVADSSSHASGSYSGPYSMYSYPVNASDNTPNVKWQRVLYTMENRTLNKKNV